MSDEFRHNVSVVIVNYDRLESTIKAVEHVMLSRGDFVREIVVVDNGSSEPVISGLHDAIGDQARIIALGANRYFGEGNNIGVEQATGAFILLLNNDAYVDPDCIPELVRTFRAHPEISAVGPMFLYPNGSVQEVGCIILENGDVSQVGKGAIWGADHYTQECAVDYCSAACLLFRKRDFMDVGGFSFQWEPAYFEDADLCLNLWQTVGPVLVNPQARVTHLESLTTSDAKMRLESQVDINRISFLEKWGEWLKAKQRFCPERPASMAFRRPGRATTAVAPGPEPSDNHPTSKISSAVLYNPYELVPGGGERYLFELGSIFGDAIGDRNVKIASPHPYSDLRIQQMSNAFGLPGPTGSITLDELRCSPPDLTVVLGNEVVPPIPGYGRRRNIYMCQFPFKAPDEYLRNHAPYLSTFDEIWVNSTFTQRYVNGHLRLLGVRGPRIRIIYPPASLPRRPDLSDWRDRTTVMTVGRFFQGGHNKRQDVVIDIVKQLNAGLGRSVPLVMAGSLHAVPSSRDRFRELQAMTDEIDCRIYPNARRDRLVELYSTSAVLIHAAGYGVDKLAFPERLEHFGIVPVEAASVGCIPVVFGEGGPAEVMASLGSPTTFHTVDQAAHLIGVLLSDLDGSEALSRELIKKSRHFSAEAFHGRVHEALAGLL